MEKLIYFTSKEEIRRIMKGFMPGTIAYEQVKRNPLGFLKSLEHGRPGVNKFANVFKRNFIKYREQLAVFLFDFICSHLGVVAGEANGIEWHRRLGGKTYALTYAHSRKIKLNPKLLVSPVLLRDTIFHEIAHVIRWRSDPNDMEHNHEFKVACDSIQLQCQGLSIQWVDDPIHHEV